MRLTDYKALIFDVDNTLIASEPFHIQAFATAVKRLFGRELTWAEAQEYIGLTSLEMSERLLEREPHDGLKAADIARLKREILPTIFRLKVFPGVKEFLATAHGLGRWRLVVASNSPRSFVESCLIDGGLFPYIDSILTCDDVTHTKPNPEIFLKAAERLGVSPADSLVFEDSAVGLDAARAGGFDSILILNPGNPVPDCLLQGQEFATWFTMLEMAEALRK